MRTIEHRADAHQFRYEQDGLACVLDYHLEQAQDAPTVMAITHTGVPRALEGQGIAADLARAALDAAQRQGWQVRPVCSYIDAYMRRHTQYQALRA